MPARARPRRAARARRARSSRPRPAGCARVRRPPPRPRRAAMTGTSRGTAQRGDREQRRSPGRTRRRPGRIATRPAVAVEEHDAAMDGVPHERARATSRGRVVAGERRGRCGSARARRSTGVWACRRWRGAGRRTGLGTARASQEEVPGRGSRSSPSGSGRSPRRRSSSSAGRRSSRATRARRARSRRRRGGFPRVDVDVPVPDALAGLEPVGDERERARLEAHAAVEQQHRAPVRLEPRATRLEPAAVRLGEDAEAGAGRPPRSRPRALPSVEPSSTRIRSAAKPLDERRRESIDRVPQVRRLVVHRDHDAERGAHFSRTSWSRLC